MKQIPAWFCLLIALLLQASAIRAQNIVVNGGFETGTFSGWTTNSGNSSGQISGSSAAHSGSYGAEFSETIIMGDIGTEDQMSQTLTTQAGTNYVLSFWANGLRQSSMGATWNGMNLLTNSIYYYPFFSSLGSDWTNFQFVLQATSTSTPLIFSFKASPGFDNSTSLTALDDVSVLPLASFNQIQAQAVAGGKVQLSFVGIPGANYALERTFNLLPPVQWSPLSTNVIGLTGTFVITTNVVANTNNFWRFRAVQ
jgi:hypothetical protein